MSHSKTEAQLSAVLLWLTPISQTIHYRALILLRIVQFPAGGVNYGTIIVDTTVGVNGAFTLVVPANMNNVNVNFYADDFRADQIQFDETVESKIFYLPGIYTEVVRDGVTRITEITFVEK